MIKPMKKPQPKPDGRIVRSVVIPPDLDARLLAFCQREERPLSWVMVKALGEYLAKHEKGGATAK